MAGSPDRFDVTLFLNVRPAAVVLACLLFAGCSGGTPATEGTSSQATSAECVLPVAPTVLFDEGGAILQTWQFPAEQVVYHSEVLPADSAFLAYRVAMERDGANLRYPVADPPTPANADEEALWRDEAFNNRLAFEEGIGDIDPITCLDALMFVEQAKRRSPIDSPAEFLVSVLRRPTSNGTELAIIFGAGPEMFPPREVYGFDVVDEFLADGWSYWYVLHNHTPQRNGEKLALGVPVPSTSDVTLSLSLGSGKGLEAARVTNGFYTFTGTMVEVGRFRAR